MQFKPMLFLIYAFINTFGITQPTPEGAGKAAKVLGWLLLTLALALTILLALLRSHL